MRYGDFQHEGGFARAVELLGLPDRPTAIFAGSDQQAFGVYEAARQRGLRIPEDLSVVGFDELPVARWASPPLTTVRQPLAEMGSAAAQMLGELIERPAAAVQPGGAVHRTHRARVDRRPSVQEPRNDAVTTPRPDRSEAEIGSGPARGRLPASGWPTCCAG